MYARVTYHYHYHISLIDFRCHVRDGEGRGSEIKPQTPPLSLPLSLSPSHTTRHHTTPCTFAAGFYHSLALQRDGSIACWGDNDFGEAPTREHDEEYEVDDYATLSANFPFMTDVHIM